jgi:hypothetical protein
MVLYYYDPHDIETVCDRKHKFERILNVEDYCVSGLPRFENLDI